MIKVFVSHQKADTDKASEIARRLKVRHQIDSYLDVIDPRLSYNGEDLARYIRTEMGKCTQLLAVVSTATKASQWVPWEIGVATEKNFPLATFADTFSKVPEFIANWPVLNSMDAVDAYAQVSKNTERDYIVKRRSGTYITEASAQRSSTEKFFTDLRARI